MLTTDTGLAHARAASQRAALQRAERAVALGDGFLLSTATTIGLGIGESFSRGGTCVAWGAFAISVIYGVRWLIAEARR